ncbi:MAG TPA: hypothetical protein VLA12_07290, partial [Planctomycetaceae bacterium]|nr:hypothetical protein [Planctomycetaceae bacterium]
MKRLNNALKSAVLVVMSLLITSILVWAGGEAYFRVRYDVVNSSSPTDWIEYDPARGWKLRPGSYSYFDVGAFNKAEISINELGLRNQPISPAVPSGKRRISVVGDSFVFAAALTEGEKFTDRLQALVGPDQEIVNVSVPGYGTWQQILLLRELARQGVDIGNQVVLVFFTNDLADNAGFEYGTSTQANWIPSFHVDEQGVLRHSTPEKIVRSADSLSLANTSIFFQFLRNRSEIVVSRFPVLLDLMSTLGYQPELGRVPGVIAAWYSDNWEMEWRRTEDIIAYLDGYLRSRQTELLVTIIPSPFQVEPAFRTLIENRKERDPRFTAYLADPDRPQRVLH